MTLIPTLSIKEFKALKVDQIRQMQSVIVTADGEHLFTAIIPPDGSGITIIGIIKTEAEYLGIRSNTAGGKEPDVVKASSGQLSADSIQEEVR